MTPLSWSAWLAATLPPRAPSLDQPARRPDDRASMLARQIRREATPPPDIVPDDTD